MITGLSLAEFRTRVSDLARPNRFEVQIFPPSILSYSTDHQNLLSWLAETSQIPARTQGEITLKYHGMEYKLPGDYAKENINIGFLNSYGWEGRNLFERWMELMQSVNSKNSKFNSYDLLNDSMVIVKQIGRVKETIASYTFYNVFPTNISAIDLNMGSNDEVEKFTVSFAYSHFKPEKALLEN